MFEPEKGWGGGTVTPSKVFSELSALTVTLAKLVGQMASALDS